MGADTKRKIMACLVGVAILTVIIAAALPRLELKPGIPLPALTSGEGQPQQAQQLPRVVISVSNFWKAIVSIALLAAFAYIGYMLLRSITWNWRDVLKTLAYTSVVCLIAGSIFWALLSGRVTLSGPATETPPPSVVEKTGPPLGSVPTGLIWLVGLGLAAILIGVGLWTILRPANRAGKDQLALQAEWALQELKKGLDLKNVIVRCYWQMGQVLQAEQGIEMETAMTVREFERLLEARGVPHLPIHQLTQLFETARYGYRATSAEDERQAVEALTSIVQYSQTSKPEPSI